MSKIDFDLMIAHHSNSLLLASRLAALKQSKLIFNTHEHYPVEFEDKHDWTKKLNPFTLMSAENIWQQWMVCLMFTKISLKYEEDFVLTYSKGIQAESAFYRAPCFILRTKTDTLPS